MDVKRFLIILLLGIFYVMPAQAQIPTRIQGSWVLDEAATTVLLATADKEKQISDLSGFRVYKYIVTESEMLMMRNDMVISELRVSVSEESPQSVLIDARPSDLDEAVVMQINFISQDNDGYIMKLSVTDTNDYLVWKRE